MQWFAIQSAALQAEVLILVPQLLVYVKLELLQLQNCEIINGNGNVGQIKIVHIFAYQHVPLNMSVLQSMDNADLQTVEHSVLLRQLIFVLQVSQEQSMDMGHGIGHVTDKTEEQINLVMQIRQ
jgi:hypothetical protein